MKQKFTFSLELKMFILSQFEGLNIFSFFKYEGLCEKLTKFKELKRYFRKNLKMSFHIINSVTRAIVRDDIISHVSNKYNSISAQGYKRTFFFFKFKD